VVAKKSGKHSAAGFRVFYDYFGGAASWQGVAAWFFCCIIAEAWVCARWESERDVLVLRANSFFFLSNLVLVFLVLGFPNESLPAFMERYVFAYRASSNQGGSNQTSGACPFVFKRCCGRWHDSRERSFPAPLFTIRDRLAHQVSQLFVEESLFCPRYRTLLTEGACPRREERNTPAVMGRGQAVLHNSSQKRVAISGASDPEADWAAVP